jgi:hypothetical protein
MTHPAPAPTLTHSLTRHLQAALDERRDLRAEREARALQIDSASERGQLAGSTLAAADSLDEQIAAVDRRIASLRIQIADAVGTTPGLSGDDARHGRAAKRANAAARSRARRPASGWAS